jgi:hypothetical protein
VRVRGHVPNPAKAVGKYHAGCSVDVRTTAHPASFANSSMRINAARLY